MTHIARIVRIGYPHHIVQRGNNKSPIFHDDRDRYRYLYLLKKYAAECHCFVHVFCLMPNHIHFVATPEEKDSFAKMMQKLSLTYTLYMNEKYERTGRLWESRFYSCVVGTEEYLWNVCRYVERNPVRARIVLEALSYKWSSALISTGNSRNNTFLKPLWKNEQEMKSYKKYLQSSETSEQLEIIRCSLRTGKPYGSEELLKRVGEELGIDMNALRLKKRGRPRNKEDTSI